MKKYIKLTIFLFIFISMLSCVVFSHPGRTDSNGGHYNRATGEYHYHDGTYEGQNNKYPSSSNDNNYLKKEQKEAESKKVGDFVAHLLLIALAIPILKFFKKFFYWLTCERTGDSINNHIFICYVIPIIISVIAWYCFTLIIKPNFVYEFIGYWFVFGIPIFSLVFFIIIVVKKESYDFLHNFGIHIMTVSSIIGAIIAQIFDLFDLLI